MSDVYNFSAGPAMLPKEVMISAQAEFLDWHELGVSVMEVSHRNPAFVDAVALPAEQQLRRLLSIPDSYHVLFLPGGANTQFSAIPMNLLGRYQSAAYAVTGCWARKAALEAARYMSVNRVVDTESAGFNHLPPESQWADFSDEAYLYYVDNETINGVEFSSVPDAKGLPLVCDMSSNLLSRPIDVTQFDLIYACAQKNLGMSGITLVIVSDKMLTRKPMATIPSIMDYRNQVSADSMYNTPPTYSWYMAGKVFDWVTAEGGLDVMAVRNQQKSDKLYAAIDQSGFYENRVEKNARSRMNVPFHLPTPELDALFVEKAAENGLVALKGHRLVGGVRASIYNAMPMAGVEALVKFMAQFERTFG